MTAKTIFVTGGAGYVGSHCCKAFALAGWNVVVYDNLSRGWRDFVKWGPLIEGDIRDAERLGSAIASTLPDAVAHFAGVAYVGESMAAPGHYYDINTRGSLNLVQAMKANGVDKIVFSSTCATYGVPETMPITEEAPQLPISPYGWSKLFVERVLIDFDRAHGIRSVILRYFNAAGADPDGEIGERHEPETHLIPLAIRASLPGGGELTIFGDDFNTPDGTCVRDFIHVSDLAEAHVRALHHLFDGGASEAFNLGSGKGVSVRTVVESVEAATCEKIRQRKGPRRQGDPAIVVADAQNAFAELGWRPVRSNISDIISDAIKWEKSKTICAD